MPPPSGTLTLSCHPSPMAQISHTRPNRHAASLIQAHNRHKVPPDAVMPPLSLVVPSHTTRGEQLPQRHRVRRGRWITGQSASEAVSQPGSNLPPNSNIDTSRQCNISMTHTHSPSIKRIPHKSANSSYQTMIQTQIQPRYLTSEDLRRCRLPATSKSGSTPSDIVPPPS